MSLHAQLGQSARHRQQQHAQRTCLAVSGTGKHIQLDAAANHVDRNAVRPPLINLAANDYLGLAQHPSLTNAAIQATQTYGTGATASRLVTGTLPPHQQLEQRFARFKHADAALLFPTGTMANLGLLTTLARPGDLIFQDKLNHACLIDGAKFSGATVRTFPHRHYGKLERLLVAAEIPPDGRIFVTTDAVFSMDGTVADLPRLLELCDQHDATLIVDEAHGTGVLGATGSGLAEAQGVAGQVPITTSTASKALGALGGIVTASNAVIDELVNAARTFIYTTAPPASVPTSIDAALDVLADESERRQRLAQLSQHVRDELRRQGWPLPDQAISTPIVPLIAGSNQAALALADYLREAGFLAVAIRPPTVAPNAARVRMSLRCDLTDAECEQLLRACVRARLKLQ